MYQNVYHCLFKSCSSDHHLIHCSGHYLQLQLQCVARKSIACANRIVQSRNSWRIIWLINQLGGSSQLTYKSWKHFFKLQARLFYTIPKSNPNRWAQPAFWLAWKTYLAGPASSNAKRHATNGVTCAFLLKRGGSVPLHGTCRNFIVSKHIPSVRLKKNIKSIQFKITIMHP